MDKSTTMDEPSYRTWWRLHLRVARGKRLDADEQAAYEAGLAQLHPSECLAAGDAALSQARAAIQTLEEEYARLRTQREQLDTEIAALETMLETGTRAPMAVKA